MIINKLTKKILAVRYFNRWLIFFIDLILSTFSTVAALALVSYILRIDFSPDDLLKILAVSVCCSVISFVSCQTYKGIIRHSTFTETGRIAMTVLLKSAFLVPFIYVFIPDLTYSVIFLGIGTDLFFTFFILTIVRAIMILFYHLILGNTISIQGKLLIFRRNRQIESSLRRTIKDKSGTYQVEGFLQFGKKESLRIGGYPIYSVKDELEFDELVSRKNVKAILFTDRHSITEESERLIRYCEKRQIRMLLSSSPDEIKKGTLNIRTLPEVRIEDLLGRDEICINMTEIAASLKGKVVLVTGAAGSIGSELCRQLCRFGLKQLVLFDSAETPMHNIRLELEEKYPNVKFVPVMGDVRMLDRVESVFLRFHPQYVFHAAAYKHVPLMEENPCEAVHTNVLGTRNVADMAVRHDVEKFIMVSTDKAVNPTNVMGASKRLAEIYVQSLSIAISKGMYRGTTRFITTRFGNVLGSNGSVIPRFREQLAKGGPLTVTHPDIIRYFMTIPEACRLVLEAAFMGKGDEIFVFDMGTPVKIADLARRMIELAGLIPDADIKIKFTGLRPGEKLYEELLATKENTLPTENEKIYRAQVREYDYNDICTVIRPLIESARNVDKLATVQQMKGIVPEFKSKNSEYERLDK